MALKTEWKAELVDVYDGVTPTVEIAQDGTLTINGQVYKIATYQQLEKAKELIQKEQERYNNLQVEATQRAKEEAIAAANEALEREKAALDGRITAEEQARINEAKRNKEAAAAAAREAKQAADNAMQSLNTYKASRTQTDEQIRQQILAATNGAIAKMQKQIDGAIDAYFESGPPATISGDGSSVFAPISTLNSETYRNKKPYISWLEDLKNGLTLQEIADRHSGDTYTNTNSDTNTDTTAGQSWRFVLNDTKTSWRWLRIADNETAKALEAAARAQQAAQQASAKATTEANRAKQEATEAAKQYANTKTQEAKNAADAAQRKANEAEAKANQARQIADGKTRTFVAKPSRYDVGDMWVLESDSVHTEGKKDDILIATATSASYNAAHWKKVVSKGMDAIVCDVFQTGTMRNGRVSGGDNGYIKFEARVLFGLVDVSDIAANNGCFQWRVDGSARGNSKILKVNSVTDRQDTIELLLDREKLYSLVKNL